MLNAGNFMNIRKSHFDIILCVVIFLFVARVFGHLISLITVPGVTQ